MADSDSTPRKPIGRPRKDHTGRQFPARLVLRLSRMNDKGRPLWWVRCRCGHELESLTQGLQQDRCPKCNNHGPRPWRRKRPYEATYNIFKGRAKYPVHLTYDQFVELTRITECHYCGDHIHWQEYRRRNGTGGTGSNLDRMDSSGPYSIENVVVCCGRCNYAKNDHFTYDEWKQLGAVVRSWRALALLQKEIEAAR